MTIVEALKNIGLNDKEAKVYVALLKLGEASAYATADASGLKRPTTYVILEGLITKGVVSRIPRTRKQLYVAKPPEELFAQTEERVRLAKSLLPELRAMSEGEKPKVRTLYYEGPSAMEETLFYGLDKIVGKELVGFYAYVSEYVTPEMLTFFDRYAEKLKRMKIKIRGIAPDHPGLKKYRDLDAAYGRIFKTVPYETYSSKTSIEIGDTFIRIFSPEDLQGVIIENPAVANTMRQIFEMVWKCI